MVVTKIVDEIKNIAGQVLKEFEELSLTKVKKTRPIFDHE